VAGVATWQVDDAQTRMHGREAMQYPLAIWGSGGRDAPSWRVPDVVSAFVHGHA